MWMTLLAAACGIAYYLDRYLVRGSS